MTAWPLGIDSSFPGGNILVERIEDDQVYLRQDLRDTRGHWFYWCFRVCGAAGRRVGFNFTDGDVIGVRGPAISRDQGQTWQWLGRQCVNGTGFVYTFAGDEGDVRFSFAMPYQESHLNAFLVKFRENRRLRVDPLCTTRQGRLVERLHFGCLGSCPRFRVIFTCRHHCCEMMANYELEGIIEEILSESQAGQWLASHVEFLALPFMDKDGVEAGDQGKNRKPHDHAMDYGETSLYPSVAALREFAPPWLEGKPALALDLHCPGPRGEFHEVILCPNRLRGVKNWRHTKPFLDILEATQQGPLVFRTADSIRFTTWDGKPPGPPSATFSSWIQSVPGIRFGAVIELPYANANGGEVNQDTARAFGRDLARASYVYLKDGTTWQSKKADSRDA